jgi:uridine kinase
MGIRVPYFIGIVGGSCAGKTWLAEKLHQKLGKESALLSLDQFYLDRRHLSEPQAERVNFDHPRSIEWARFEKVLQSFASGEGAAVPRYDYATHSRLDEETHLQPAPVMILEGLWLFRKSQIRNIFNLRIFLNTSVETCERRRLERDVRERGRTLGQVREQFRATVAPSHFRYVAPQERWANLVLDQPDEETLCSIAAAVRQEIAKSSSSL